MTRRDTLTVQELASLCDKAATKLDDARSQHDDVARLIVDDLRGVAMLAQDVVLSSGQGCAADEVILSLKDEHENDDMVACLLCGAEMLAWQKDTHDAHNCPGVKPLPHAYRVWFRFVDEDRQTARAALFDATSEGEAKMMAERRYAGEANVVIISAEDLDARSAVRS